MIGFAIGLFLGIVITLVGCALWMLYRIRPWS